MPYIDCEKRDALEQAIEVLSEQLSTVNLDDLEGVLNYTITTLLCNAAKPYGGWRYRFINRAVGVLECVKLEFYRRIASKYEEKQIENNGDLPVFQKIC